MGRTVRARAAFENKTMMGDFRIFALTMRASVSGLSFFRGSIETSYAKERVN